MESTENDIGEKVKLIAMTLGKHKKYDNVYFVGDSESIGWLDNTQEWSAKINNLRIEYRTIENKEYSNELAQVRVKGFIFSKTIYRKNDEFVSCESLGLWEDELNKLYAKAVRLKRWREEIAEIKNNSSLDFGNETKCSINQYSTR
jgi:hypothetical protein